MPAPSERLGLVARFREQHADYQRQLDATGRQINALIYVLHGLSDAEARIEEEVDA